MPSYDIHRYVNGDRLNMRRITARNSQTALETAITDLRRDYPHAELEVSLDQRPYEAIGMSVPIKPNPKEA